MASTTEDQTIRILCVDDHPLLREGLASIIATQADMAVEAQASNGREGIRLHRQVGPDVTLMDLRLPDMSGIDALIAIRAECPTARIIILSTFQGDVEIQRALEAGARGFLLKSMQPADLLEGIRQVYRGKRAVPPDVASSLAAYLDNDALTAREIEILQLIAAGNRNRDVAERLLISEDTVKVHVRHAMEKLGTRDRTGAVVVAARRGFIQI